VYPREVEEAIAAVAGVRETLVRGESDPVWGQAVTAYVVGDAAVADIRRALERRLAKYKIPKRIEQVAELP
jgi:acyl-CoA synthetase (AMP-forming)/AMP-acid ligase II